MGDLSDVLLLTSFNIQPRLPFTTHHKCLDPRCEKRLRNMIFIIQGTGQKTCNLQVDIIAFVKVYICGFAFLMVCTITNFISEQLRPPLSKKVFPVGQVGIIYASREVGIFFLF